ncbi:hypothetical protein HAX54_015548, partial [Datura stramonium]|nr:hypothetical protein [Datura stramonium]
GERVASSSHGSKEKEELVKRSFEDVRMVPAVQEQLGSVRSWSKKERVWLVYALMSGIIPINVGVIIKNASRVKVKKGKNFG